MQHVTIVGAGLAGCEAALQLAARGVPVRLVEMRPGTMPPAHHTGDFAELVCSNSLKGTDPASAAGLLKHELGELGSFVLGAAYRCRVPAGSALAVDRTAFSQMLTRMAHSHPTITVIRQETTDIPDGDVIVAAGPLPGAALEDALTALVGSGRLAFFDAAAPIISAESLDHDRTFPASRWGKGGADYLNCPLTRDEYAALISALVSAERVHAKAFEKRELFSACQPVEEVARTGLDALRFGALKPVGLTDPQTGRRPWAVVQLRPETATGSAYNLVGFQTNLTFAEQRRVFSLIPALEHAEFLRYGVMHRNSFVDAPRLLTPGLAVRSEPHVRIAGQLSGTEGYLEAAASGIVAALDVLASRNDRPSVVMPPTTAIGSLLAYATDPETVDYQPMHVNFGLMPPLDPPVRGKRERYAAYAERAHKDMAAFLHDRPDLAPPHGRVPVPPAGEDAVE
ncbi:MAG: methylenetetrahydrofolate--tRNA-(uracil(54)-C(5))-methyltransferase (FADH(2)-oxidizing) TrmFO [Coriobacteriia bacterium]|nr:methylenetetrahydrofolate--tRNA-(uracil(54)-C(5))-methyltransferase (FADH(2)-oxidizing) TrmFO [Coriobacteriia bacterium]